MKYYIIAGEASGDLHGSNLMRGLFKEDPQAEIRFWGGENMESVNPDQSTLVRHYREGAVMGFTDVIGKAGKLLRNVAFCKKDIRKWKPDVVILIDYPGFNFKIAKYAHGKGIKVFYYIAPKTWASRESRNFKLKQYVDKLFIVFPFEIPYFEKHGIDFVYKGNPLIDAVDAAALQPEKISYRKPYIAILAGSRGGEIKRMMPVCMKMADKLHSLPEYANYHFVVAGAPSRDAEDYDLGGRKYVSLVFGDTYGILRNAEAAVINSGTASLEAALIGTPQVVGWSTSALTFFIIKNILKVAQRIKFISLGNLILDRGVFRELIQKDFNADAVAGEIRKLIEDSEYRSTMKKDYAEIRNVLGGSGASAAVAAAMIENMK